ncbi:MAG: ABC transporter ATP-binding protein [Oceanococcaceae bacterium]
MTVGRGETLAILGPSGSGKSTLLSLLAGFDQPTSGEIALGGQPLSGQDEDARAALRAATLGFVFQSFALLPQATALDNVRIAAEIAGVLKPDEAARAQLERVGLGHRLKHRPAQLSGGEQQRVALARAFVHRPALVLADEPTGNLDADTGQRIITQMFDLNRDNGTALVLVTHDPALAERCERQLHLREGQLVPRAPRTASPVDALSA